MVIFLNTDGSAQIITPKAVYQGSDNVTDITVIAPFSAQTTMSIGFILPNGLYWFAPPLDPNDPHSGGNYAPMVFVKQNFTTKANVWKYTLPRSVTEMPGVVRIAINAAVVIDVIDEDGERNISKSNCTSFLCDFTVQESVVPILPATQPPADVYELLRQYLSYLDGRTANVPNLVKSIQQTASNAFTFTKNNGDVSKPIVFGKAGYDPIYDVAAYVGEIAGPTEENPNGEWQPNNPTNPTSYSHVIDADTHGQMQEGVSADDLWVSFVSENGTGFDGVYQGYTVDAAGDITITATTPVALTVRVWNGKGLVDTTARADIKTETERAKTAEAALQTKINSDVATEKARAEAAEESLETKINNDIAAETSRAIVAESNLQNQIDKHTEEIEELQNTGVDTTARANIEQIEALIPSTATPENQLADKEFVISAVNNSSGGETTPATPTTLGTVYGCTSYIYSFGRGQGSTALGYNAFANAENTTAIGYESKTNAYYSTAIGYGAFAGSIESIALGGGVGSNSNCSIAIGRHTYTNGNNSIAIGAYANTTKSQSIAIGHQASTWSEGAIAIGTGANAQDSLAIGIMAKSKSDGATALGERSNANGYCATAIGYNANVNAWYSTAIGHGAIANVTNSIVLGDLNVTSLRCNVQTITALSDERTKEEIQLANTAQCLADVNKLPVKRFKFKKGIHPTEIDVHRTGFIAQDVEKVFPKEVETDPSSFWAVDANGEYIYEDETDDDGNVVYEDELDANGERIVESETIDENGELVITYKQVVKRKHKEYTIEDCKKINMHDALPTLWAAVQELSKQLSETKVELAKVKSFVKYVATESEVTE